MNWSDDESNDINKLPPRDIPKSENESENDEYNYNIVMKTSNNSFIDIKKPEIKKQQKVLKKSSKNILPDLFVNNQPIERKFNPRLPPPNKYKKK